MPTSSPPPLTRPTRRRFAATLLVAVVAASSLAACSRSDRAAGTPLPDVALIDMETGEAATWPTGTPMVVNFWASWCAPCRTEMPAFQRVADALGAKVVIVGVTDEDDLTKAQAAAEAAGVSYPLLVDVDQELLTRLGVSGLPGTVFVDADGNVVGRHLGALTEAQLTREIEERHGITA